MKVRIASTTSSRQKVEHANSPCCRPQPPPEGNSKSKINTRYQSVCYHERRKVEEITISTVSCIVQSYNCWMWEAADSGVQKGSRAKTKMGGSLPTFTEIHLMRGKKFDIFVEGGSTLIKHGTHLSIFIISSQLGGGADAGVSF